jgi:hypothetical protein
MVTRRTLLLSVTALLCAAALYAIAIVLVGRFDETDGRILGTAFVIVAMSLLALPAVVLAERRRAFPLAEATIAGAVLAAALGVATVWSPGDPLGQLTATAVAATALGTQVTALIARRRDDDPPVVHHLFLASVASGLTLATLVVVLTWGQFDSPGYGRVLGAAAILDALLVALQPLLARLRPPLSPTPR